MKCPRCDGQQYDRDNCGLCESKGWLCDVCGGPLRRWPIYFGGRPSEKCRDCGAVYVKDVAVEEVDGKLIPLRVGQYKHEGEL